MSRGQQRKYPPAPASIMENRIRKHKGMTFVPVARGKKRKLKSLLTQKNKRIDGRLADKRYFRIYKHKGQRYTLYIGPEKYSHGGLRHRPKTKGSSATRKLKQAKAHETTIKFYEDNQDKIKLDDYQRIDFGPHEGKYLDKNTGEILSENQIRILIAERGVDK